MDSIILFLIIGCAAGAVSGYLLYRISKQRLLRRAEFEAREIIGEAQTDAELLDLELAAKQKEIDEELEEKNQEYFNRILPRIDELTEIVESRSEESKEAKSLFLDRRKKAESGLQSAEDRYRNAQNARAAQKARSKELQHQTAEKIALAFELDLNNEKQIFADQMIQSDLKRLQDHLEQMVREVHDNSEVLGKNLLDVALFRFQRLYCPERGIASVYYETSRERQILTEAVAQQTQLLVGCDIFIDAESNLVGVSGFDPVRRELARRVLEKLKREQQCPNERRVEQVFSQEKRNLLQAIQRDGKEIARELKMKNLHPEVEQMMGSLRYRYSFTQNQYFHCGEVGFLCGLLAAELNSSLPFILSARRAGLLHDIGKAMDHDQEGGHAMIGSNFIEARKESAEVVHAVRAHHFDETPSTDLAFLVIGADAISGARPGARRSTVETYNQKVSDMVSIAQSFPGVVECLVLSGGRECRVWVDSKKLGDHDALKLGQEITRRIEAELSYPGQIKVVIIRETAVFEQTRHA